jgi:hypothetical protein
MRDTKDDAADVGLRLFHHLRVMAKEWQAGERRRSYDAGLAPPGVQKS